MNPLISPAEATKHITDSLVTTETEVVNLNDALNRVLAQDIVADRDSPPFDRVMMDGICINTYNHILGSWRYKIIGTQAAGEKKMLLPKGEFTIEVMTGAPLPTDANCVIPVEQIDIVDGYALPHDGIDADDYQFIHRQGSDCKQGEIILEKGTVLTANELAILASLGATEIKVSRLPKIQLLTTGDEVIAPEETPTDYQIRRSHPSAIRGLIDANKLGEISDQHLTDDPEAIESAIATALESNDVLILTGGISMGKFDWVAPLLKKLLGEPAFHGVSQRPGKPFAFWKPTETSPVVFALPGNPVSVMATMHRYVLPALKQMLGQPLKTQKVSLAEDFQWNTPLTGILAYRLQDGKALICPPSNSGNHLALKGSQGFAQISPSSLHKADSLVEIF